MAEIVWKPKNDTKEKVAHSMKCIVQASKGKTPTSSSEA